MLDTKGVSLNNLRVASSEWPGIVYYQGVTNRMALSTEDKATQTNPSHKPLAASSHSLAVGRDRKTLTDAGDSSLEKEKTTIAKEKISDKKTPRPFLTHRSLKSSPPSESISTHSQKDGVSQSHDKVLLPLPNVSCNELVQVDGTFGERSFLQLNMSWNPSQRVLSRPQTAGPRVIVPPKHSGPVGLNEKEFIRGTRLWNGDSSSDEDQNINRHHGNISNVTSAEETKQSITSRHGLNRKIHEKDDDRSTLGVSTHRDRDEDLKPTVLELTITSLRPQTGSGFNNAYAGDLVDDNATSDYTNKDECLQNRHENSSSLSMQSYNLNTIDGIRKSFRRAQSAPPTHGRSHRIQSVNLIPPEGNSGMGKNFSNLYWRAKSAYHKRLDEAEEIPEEMNNNDTGDSKNPCSKKHTLLRPLLRVDGDIKHSSGCPYKCKGCFKACLVSDDYVRKAIAKASAAQQGERVTESKKESLKQGRPHSRSDLIKDALGRCQPLFQKVYGGNKITERVKIRPWPVYGWMDLKANKSE